jgi:chemotaxis response regulator CheB
MVNSVDLSTKPTQAPAFDIVAVGASADGVDVVSRLLTQFPRNFAGAVLVVMHRPVERTSYLPEILARKIELSVLVASKGQELRSGHCYLAVPDRHLTIGPDLRVHLLHDSFYRSHNIDALFSSLARHAGTRTIGVILSGMLKDGTLGLRAIIDAGGVAMVQSPRDAAHPEMPLSAINHSGHIDLVAPIDMLARDICRRVGTTALPHRLAS